jgi:hypothetical protein
MVGTEIGGRLRNPFLIWEFYLLFKISDEERLLTVFFFFFFSICQSTNLRFLYLKSKHNTTGLLSIHINVQSHETVTLYSTSIKFRSLIAHNLYMNSYTT